MNVVVCAKQIPDPALPGALDPADHTLVRGGKLACRVRPDDTAATGEHERFHDGRQRDRAWAQRSGIVDRKRGEPRHRETSVPEALTRQALVVAGAGGVRRVKAKPERGSRARRDDHWTIAHRQHAGKRRTPGLANDRRDRGLLIVEAHGYRAIAPRVVERLAAIGRERDVDAQTFGRLAERSRLVPGGGRDEKYAGHR